MRLRHEETPSAQRGWREQMPETCQQSSSMDSLASHSLDSLASRRMQSPRRSPSATSSVVRATTNEFVDAGSPLHVLMTVSDLQQQVGKLQEFVRSMTNSTSPPAPRRSNAHASPCSDSFFQGSASESVDDDPCFSPRVFARSKSEEALLASYREKRARMGQASAGAPLTLRSSVESPLEQSRVDIAGGGRATPMQREARPAVSGPSTGGPVPSPQTSRPSSQKPRPWQQPGSQRATGAGVPLRERDGDGALDAAEKSAIRAASSGRTPLRERAMKETADLISTHLQEKFGSLEAAALHAGLTLHMCTEEELKSYVSKSLNGERHVWTKAPPVGMMSTAFPPMHFSAQRFEDAVFNVFKVPNLSHRSVRDLFRFLSNGRGGTVMLQDLMSSAGFKAEHNRAPVVGGGGKDPAEHPGGGKQREDVQRQSCSKASRKETTPGFEREEAPHKGSSEGRPRMRRRSASSSSECQSPMTTTSSGAATGGPAAAPRGRASSGGLAAPQEPAAAAGPTAGLHSDEAFVMQSHTNTRAGSEASVDAPPACFGNGSMLLQAPKHRGSLQSLLTFAATVKARCKSEGAPHLELSDNGPHREVSTFAPASSPQPQGSIVGEVTQRLPNGVSAVTLAGESQAGPPPVVFQQLPTAPSQVPQQATPVTVPSVPLRAASPSASPARVPLTAPPVCVGLDRGWPEANAGPPGFSSASARRQTSPRRGPLEAPQRASVARALSGGYTTPRPLAPEGAQPPWAMLCPRAMAPATQGFTSSAGSLTAAALRGPWMPQAQLRLHPGQVRHIEPPPAPGVAAGPWGPRPPGVPAAWLPFSGGAVHAAAAERSSVAPQAAAGAARLGLSSSTPDLTRREMAPAAQAGPPARCGAASSKLQL